MHQICFYYYDEESFLQYIYFFSRVNRCNGFNVLARETYKRVNGYTEKVKSLLARYGKCRDTKVLS